MTAIDVSQLMGKRGKPGRKIVLLVQFHRKRRYGVGSDKFRAYF